MSPRPECTTRQGRGGRPPRDPRRVAGLGHAAALAVTWLGVAYAAGLGLVAVSSGAGPLRPSAELQWWAALGTLAICPPIVVVFYCLAYLRRCSARRVAPVSLGMAVLFGLTVVTSRTAFLLIRDDSPFRQHLLAAEFLGWGLFLSMAIVSVTWILRTDPTAAGLRRVGATYAGLALVGTAAFVVSSPVFVVGFLAWGVVLYLWFWLFARWFRTAADSSPAALATSSPAPQPATHDRNICDAGPRQT